MTPEQLVKTACPVIGAVGAAFYFIPETLAVGKEHGLGGFQWYVLGRGGVLGDVEAPVVEAAFGYFAPALIGKLWTASKAIMAPREAGHRYHQCAADLGRAKFSAIPNLGAYCEAAGAVVAAARPAGLSLFAGIAAEPLADDLPGRAMQLTAVLRELRGSAHLVAVIASGLTAKEAHHLRRPNDWKTFGYDDDDRPAVTPEGQAKLDAAEALTDQLVLPAYSAVDESGAQALADGVSAMQAALS